MPTIKEVQTALCSRYGLSIDEDRQSFLLRAVQDIGRDSNIPEHEVMVRALTNSNMLKEVAGRITVPESFFFRHPEQLKMIADFLRERLEETDPSYRIRIWSAGCSQGEEPLSLAILLKETLKPEDLNRISIFGSDISSNSISAARNGIFSIWSFRGLSEIRKCAFFKMLDERTYKINSAIHSMVTFHHNSIQEQLATIQPDSIDVIMFRNVAIYFAKEAIEPIYNKLCCMLKPDGLLCLSYSDPPIQFTKFEGMEDLGLSVYRKSLPSIPPLEEQTDRMPVSTESYKTACISENESSIAKAESSDYMRGRDSLNQDNHAASKEYFRRALFDNPSNKLVRFWYAVTLFEDNFHKRAIAQMNALAEELSITAANQLLEDGKTRAAELLRTVHMFKIKMEKENDTI